MMNTYQIHFRAVTPLCVVTERLQVHAQSANEALDLSGQALLDWMERRNRYHDNRFVRAKIFNLVWQENGRWKDLPVERAEWVEFLAPKIITTTDLADAVKRLLLDAADQSLPGYDEYQGFFGDLAELVCNYTVGEVTGLAQLHGKEMEEWAAPVKIVLDSNLIEDAGPWGRILSREQSEALVQQIPVERQLSAKDLAELLGLMLDVRSPYLDDPQTFGRFVTDVAEVICKWCGGFVWDPAKLAVSGKAWIVRIGRDASLPDDGGIWQNYDPDISFEQKND